MSEEEITVPEIDVFEFRKWLDQQPGLLVLDVREPYEFPRAKLEDERVVYLPLSEMVRKGVEALPEEVKENRSANIVVICHHGNRSAQVTAWLLDMGWEAVYNLAGGIDAYARQIDPGIGLY